MTQEHDPVAAWADDLSREVVTPIAADDAAALAGAALAGMSASAGVVATAVTGHIVAKVIGGLALAGAMAGGIAAATGSLPDPVQTWIADLVDGIGIELPRPADLIPTLPPDLPGEPIPGMTTPELTIPDLPPIVTIP